MLPEAASEQYRVQQGITAVTVASVNRIWARMGDDFDESWETLRGRAVTVAETGRGAAVSAAIGYTAAVLRETGFDAPSIGQLNPDAFLSAAPDGRAVAGLLDQAPVKAKTLVSRGLTTSAALAAAGQWLSTATLTLMADTRREVYGADIIQRPAVTGYVRMLNPPSCADCIILAGKWFRWNTGFERHPRCDCIHVPAPENAAQDPRTDPYETFKSMGAEQQERTFGRSEARAIREGADIYKTVNQSNRKLSTANSRIDQIYRTAGTRTNAVRMLRQEGFILERGQKVVPLSPGVRTDAQILAAGRGRGTVTIAGQSLTTGRAARFDAAQTGARDPLNRTTMTAAERRLYDAHYRLEYALRTGNVPRSIGVNTADRYATPIIATPAKLAELRTALADQIALLGKKSTPESVRRVARALGLL